MIVPGQRHAAEVGMGREHLGGLLCITSGSQDLLGKRTSVTLRKDQRRSGVMLERGRDIKHTYLVYCSQANIYGAC